MGSVDRSALRPSLLGDGRSARRGPVEWHCSRCGTPHSNPAKTICWKCAEAEASPRKQKQQGPAERTPEQAERRNWEVDPAP
eukprot:10107047-Alexandrium_andersonii.AAC.1